MPPFLQEFRKQQLPKETVFQMLQPLNTAESPSPAALSGLLLRLRQSALPSWQCDSGSKKSSVTHDLLRAGHGADVSHELSLSLLARVP